jgi:hypothetical protein
LRTTTLRPEGDGGERERERERQIGYTGNPKCLYLYKPDREVRYELFGWISAIFFQGGLLRGMPPKMASIF